MRVKSVRLKNFRNHRSTNINFSENINIFFGKNGQGKTNILDGLTYLCLTKGFLSSSDSNSVLFGESDFELEAEFCSDLNVTSKAKVLFSPSVKGKNLFQNDMKVDRAVSFVGLYPIVLLAPQFYDIVSGVPQDRRKFVDLVISQSSKSYLNDVIEFKKVLKQRNKLLFDIKTQKSRDFDSIEYWNGPLVKYGASVISKRHNFIKEFVPFFVKAYTEITAANELPSIKYMPGISIKDVDSEYEAIPSIFESDLHNCAYDEFRRGSTIIGPHKDEFEFKINGFDVRQFASQGQQKTFLVALKIAEFFYLEDKCAEKPILVLDDLFSELDRDRSKFLLNFLQDKCQVFISSTNSDIFDEVLKYNGTNNKYYVEEGRIF
jgi:DNA replication and repair protein RecF